MKDDFRKIQPQIFPVGDPVLPDPILVKLSNDIPVYILEAGTEDVTRIEFTFRAGVIREHVPLLASTTNMMLKEGTENFTSEELNRKLDFFGAFLNPSLDKDRAGITVFCLSRHIGKILELSHEILFRPVFPKNEYNTLMAKRLQWFRINREKVQNIAIDKFFECIFGRRHPYGRRTTENDFTSMCQDLLNDFHLAHYTASNMAIILSGRIPEGTIGTLEEIFGNIKTSSALHDTPELPSGTQKKIVHLEKEGNVQTAIRIGSATINKRHHDYPGLKVADSILGGYFGSRLMRNIREDKGYTYGIRSGVSSLDLSGYKVISTEVGNEYVQQTIEEIYKEIRLLQKEHITSEELETVRNYMSGEMLRMFDGPFAIAESFKSAWEFGLDNTYFIRLAEKIRTITPDEIMYLANTYYNIDNLYQVTAG